MRVSGRGAGLHGIGLGRSLALASWVALPTRLVRDEPVAGRGRAQEGIATVVPVGVDRQRDDPRWVWEARGVGTG